MNDLPAVPPKVIVERGTAPHTLCHGGIKIDNVILFSWPNINNDNKMVTVRNLAGVTTDRYCLLTNPVDLLVCLCRDYDKPHVIPLVYQHADGNEGRVNNNADLPLTTPLMLVAFLLWGLSIKNQSVITIVREVHGDKLAMELPSHRRILVSIESILVTLRAVQHQRACVDVNLQRISRFLEEEGESSEGKKSNGD